MNTHVGFVTDSFLDQDLLFEGGAERVLYRLALLAKRLGVEVTIYQGGAVTGNFEYEGINVVRRRVNRHSLGSALASQALVDGCTHLHFQFLELVPGGLPTNQVTASSHGVFWDFPYATSYRSWYPSRLVTPRSLAIWRRLQKARSLRGLRRSMAVLSVDSSLLRIVQSDAPELRSKVDVVLNFSDLAPGEPLSTNETDGLKAIQCARERGRIVILVPRNLSLARGAGWLVEIVESVVQTHAVDCEFFVTGLPVPVYGRAEQYRRNLEGQLDRALPNVVERLSLLGGVPHKDMATAYELADIVLFPTFAYEGCPLGVLEAMTCGRPVVATNIGGFNDVIVDGVTGLLVSPEVQSIARAISNLARDSARRKALGTEAQRQALMRFTLPEWEKRATRFMMRAGWIDEVGDPQSITAV